MESGLDQRLVHLPVSALTTLSRRCASFGGEGAGALREAGYRAGIELFTELADEPELLPPSTFWLAVDAAVGRLGLGTVSFRPVTPALAAVAWRGSPEARGSRPDGGTLCCHFASGLLGGLLSRAAGRTVGVIEARCRSEGSEPCWFLVGAPDRLRAAESDAADRAPLHEALSP